MPEQIELSIRFTSDEKVEDSPIGVSLFCPEMGLSTPPRASQLGDSYWLYVVWDPLGNPEPEPLRIQNPVKHLDHAKREVVALRYFDIPAETVEKAARSEARGS